MSSKPQLAIASWGDPRGAGTWSGTPVNLIAALEKQGIEILDLTCGVPLAQWRLPMIAERVLGRDADHTLRRLGGKTCARLAQNLPPTCAGIVHMGSTTVPPPGSTPGVRNFLMCDALNDYWEKDSPAPKFRNRTPLQRKIAEEDERAAVGKRVVFPDISARGGQSARSLWSQSRQNHRGWNRTRPHRASANCQRLQPEERLDGGQAAF